LKCCWKMRCHTDNWQEGADWEQSRSGENETLETTTTISESIVIVVVNNNVRMLLKTTTINASFFTYLFVNSGGIFHLLWGDQSGSEYAFSFQISFWQDSGVWSNLEFEVAVWSFLGLKVKEKNTSEETFD